MSDTPSPKMLRLIVGVMLGCSIALIAGALWMIATDRGAPVFVAVGGAMMAAFASIIASQIKKP